jgi:asparagine synthetase B (glutamine-hydrolysing)
MCAIWILLGSEYDHQWHAPEFMRIANRGPDYTVAAKVENNVVLGFHRLAIVKVGFIRDERSGYEKPDYLVSFD